MRIAYLIALERACGGEGDTTSSTLLKGACRNEGETTTLLKGACGDEGETTTLLKDAASLVVATAAAGAEREDRSLGSGESEVGHC